jgi:hypothetical protein
LVLIDASNLFLKQQRIFNVYHDSLARFYPLVVLRKFQKVFHLLHLLAHVCYRFKKLLVKEDLLHEQLLVQT